MTRPYRVTGATSGGLLGRALSALRRWALPRPSDAAPALVPAAPDLPQRLPIEDQSARTQAYLALSIERALSLTGLQRSAAEHLDGAAYALDRLYIELAPAMAIPGRTPAPVVARIEPRRFERPERIKHDIAA